MGKLKLSPNLFLEVAELSRFRKFIEDDGYKLFMKYLTKSFGIAQNSDNTLFKVSNKAGTDDTVTINAGVAFDEDMNIIILKEDKDITIDYSATKQWIVISHATSNVEEGTVSISSTGTLSGTDTKFTEVLRGQPNFPTKVKLISDQEDNARNTGEYEVVEVNSDTEAVLSGDFTAETELHYAVIGTFTPGFQADSDNKLIYEYDSCNIEVIESEDKPTLEDGQFIIASLTYNNGWQVTDERLDYLFNYEKVASTSNTNVSNDPFVALRSTTLRLGRMLDVQFEWGYKVNRFEVINTSTQNIFNILTGEALYIGSSKITDDMFAGWLLVNRKNMVSVVIDSNENNYLYITKYNSEIVTNEDDDFVIVPNYKEIEVEIELTGTNYDEDDYKFYHKFSIENLRSRFLIPLEYLDSEITLQYRLKSDSKTTSFQNFAITQFTNTLGELETLGASSFEVNISEPETEIRNYS